MEMEFKLKPNYHYLTATIKLSPILNTLKYRCNAKPKKAIQFPIPEFMQMYGTEMQCRETLFNFL